MMPRISRTLRWSTLLLGVGLVGATIAVIGRKIESHEKVATTFARASLSPPKAASGLIPLSDANSVEHHFLGFIPSQFDRRWHAWQAGPQTAHGVLEIAAALEELAVTDPNRAMALALGESNSDLREKLRGAVLKGWASALPADAAAWVMAQPPGEHHVEMEAVFSGASVRPEEAVTLGLRICAQDPTLAGDYGQLLVAALSKAGAHETAVHFATAASSENSLAWLNVAFFQWASQEPAQALRSLDGISDPEQRVAAFHGLVAGWSETNPAAAATFAMKLGPSGASAEALGQALSQWVNRDPVAASEWLINNDKPSPNLDEGAAIVATLPSLISKKPEIAVAWAESISDPVLRADTLQAVAREWALRDPREVRQFIVSTPSLSADEQLALSKGLEGFPAANDTH